MVDNRPVVIWDEFEAKLYYDSSEEMKAAWNEYAERAALEEYRHGPRSPNVIHQ